MRLLPSVQSRSLSRDYPSSEAAPVSWKRQSPADYKAHLVVVHLSGGLGSDLVPARAAKRLSPHLRAGRSSHAEAQGRRHSKVRPKHKRAARDTPPRQRPRACIWACDAMSHASSELPVRDLSRAGVTERPEVVLADAGYWPTQQAELGMTANAQVRNAISQGYTALTTVDQVAYVANGRGHAVDEFRLDEVARVVGRITVPPPLAPSLGRLAASPAAPSAAPQPAPSAVRQFGAPGPDALGQLRRLGDLRTAGLVSDAEFEAKKAELLRRVRPARQLRITRFACPALEWSDGTWTLTRIGRRRWTTCDSRKCEARRRPRQRGGQGSNANSSRRRLTRDVFGSRGRSSESPQSSRVSYTCCPSWIAACSSPRSRRARPTSRSASAV